jgi:hypothetical protein
VAQKVDPKVPPPLSDKEEQALIAKFKATWRAQDGETPPRGPPRRTFRRGR